METQLTAARTLADKIRSKLASHADLYYAGYTQDALKEFVEANVTCALIQNHPLQTPEELGVEDATYLNGLAEVVGELRRRTLDILRHGYSQEAERLLSYMDEIYSVLVTMDYPDADHEWFASSDRPGTRHHREDARRRDLQPARRKSDTSHQAVEQSIKRRAELKSRKEADYPSQMK